MMPSRWFWISFLVGAFAMSCVSQTAKAQGAPGTLSATSITGTSRFTTGLAGTLNAVLIETERRSYHQAAVTIPWGTLGAAAKAGVRGVVRFSPYALAAMSIADAMGWVKDGDWYNKGDGTPSRELGPASYYICAKPSLWNIHAKYCVEPERAASLATWLIGKVPFDRPGSSVTAAEPRDGTVWYRATYPDGSTALSGYVETEGRPAEGTYETPEYSPATQVTEQEMLDQMASTAQGQHNMLHDANGAPHPFPEVVSALNGMASNIGAQTGTTPEVTTEPVNPGQTSPTDPAPNTGGEGSELPAFCEWARVVCDFIEWYKDEGDPLEKEPMPWDESEIQMQEWSSGQSGGSCPAPVSTSAMGEEVEFSYQPICDFAESMYGVMIAMALAVAAFIIAGLRSGKA